jgi:Zn-dependent M28 family amino/carboxypeptidase
MVGVGACAPGQDLAGDAQLQAALETISADQLTEHVKVLSSDEFEGRFPGTAGEEKTLAYLQEQFQKLGWEPGNGDSWLQEVSLVSITADPAMSMTVSGEGASETYVYGDDVMAWTKRVVDGVGVMNSELVFVGYGSVAPEYGWDDYGDLEYAGKTVVILVNDPGFATEDPELFNGLSMTYYGRWTYKYEEAARQGAAAAIVVHETEPAAYGWDVVRGSWSGPQLDMVSEDDNMSRVEVEGWVTVDVAREIFGMAGLDYDELKAQAARPGFEPLPMGVRASMSIDNTIERSTSHNFVALLPGTDRADEYVMYMGHWDHLGYDPGLEGDGIYNGALDNATGTAGLIELAEAYASLETRPSRSILIMATTAEEQGLLGSAAYASNPIYAPEKTAAAINIDGLNIYGPMKDIVVVGYGNSELDDYLAVAAETQDRYLVPDPEAEKGYFYRSDHFPLAKGGIPALYTDTGDEHLEFGAEYTRQKKDEYTAQNYHKPSDEYSEDWDLRGAVDDVRLFFMVGYMIANESTFPKWKEGTEFKAKRDAMMGT